MLTKHDFHTTQVILSSNFETARPIQNERYEFEVIHINVESITQLATLSTHQINLIAVIY